jgi:hypothetical protein
MKKCLLLISVLCLFALTNVIGQQYKGFISDIPCDLIMEKTITNSGVLHTITIKLSGKGEEKMDAKRTLHANGQESFVAFDNKEQFRFFFKDVSVEFGKAKGEIFIGTIMSWDGKTKFYNGAGQTELAFYKKGSL